MSARELDARPVTGTKPVVVKCVSGGGHQARAGLAAATMRGASYLAVGGVSMGIAGSIVDPAFLERFLGLRYEMVDTSEFMRRIDEGIFDPDEFKRGLAWVKENCREGPDNNPKAAQHSRAVKDREWETVVKMTMIARDLMVGNPRLAELGFGEEALGHNAIASGFQGQRQWTDHFPNGDFLETMLNTSFDWNGIREAYVCATENDWCNGISMLFGHLLTGTAQIFSDVRTYWSPEAVKRVTGKGLEGRLESCRADLDFRPPGDFHAAHERFIYDRLMERGVRLETQELMFPEVVELPRDDRPVRKHPAPLDDKSAGVDEQRRPARIRAVRDQDVAPLQRADPHPLTVGRQRLDLAARQVAVDRRDLGPAVLRQDLHAGDGRHHAGAAIFTDKGF